MSANAHTESIAPLTGIRGVAALWVVFYHLGDKLERSFPDWILAHQVIARGYLGVDLFAFLSGFIIAYTYADRLSVPSRAVVLRYVWLRFVRTYPLHLFVLTLFVCVALSREGMLPTTSFLEDGRFWRQLLLLHGLGFEEKFSWNVPSWSLSSEWLCYLLFPAVAPWLVRVKSGTLAIAMVVATLLATIAAMNGVGYPRFDTFLDYGWLRIGGEFFTGCWLCRVHQSGLLARRPLGWICILALLLVVLALEFASWKTLTPVIVSIFALMILALAQNRAPFRGLFGNRAMVYLGEISYSVYMLHWFVLVNAKTLGTRNLPEKAQPLVILGLVLVGASASYHLVEQVSRRRLRDAILPARAKSSDRERAPERARETPPDE